MYTLNQKSIQVFITLFAYHQPILSLIYLLLPLTLCLLFVFLFSFFPRSNFPHRPILLLILKPKGCPHFDILIKRADIDRDYSIVGIVRFLKLRLTHTLFDHDKRLLDFW